MCSIFRFLAVALLAMAPAMCGSLRAASADAAQAVLDRARASWKAYVSFAERLQGRYSSKSTVDGKVVSDQDSDVKFNGNKRLFIHQRRAWSPPDRATWGEVVAVNDRYA